MGIEQLNTHTATGSPVVVDAVAVTAMQIVDKGPATAVEVSTLALVYILAKELAEALRRIEELERYRYA